jgi:ankyrin repeat protein
MSEEVPPSKKLCKELDEAIKKLDEDENDKTKKNKQMYSPFHFNCLINNKSINEIKKYFELIDLDNCKNSIFASILKRTNNYSYEELEELMDLLKDKDFDFENDSELHIAPLRYSISIKNTNLVLILITKYKIDLNKNSALHFALIYSNNEIAKELLLNLHKYDININLQKDDDLSTPIMLAAYYHNTEIFNLLFNNPKIDLTLKNKYGSTVLISACNNMSPIITSNHEIINSLLTKKDIININDTNNYGNTALNMATNNTNDYIRLVIMTLLEAGADPNIPDNNGDTPLLSLVKSEYGTSTYNIISGMMLLLNKGANIKHRNNNGETIYSLMSSNLKEYFEICYLFNRSNVNNKIFINSECLICNEKEDKMVYVEPCQHIVICFKCFQNLVVFSANNETFCKCPLCNTHISNHTIVEYINQNN